MALELMSVDELTIEDESSFRHVELVGRLKARLKADGVRFAVPAPGSGIDHPPAVSLLNLAFWRPGGVAEIFVDEHVSADQLAHSAWHHLASQALGEHAVSAEGLLLAEAIASAFDVYLVGRLLGHAPESSFLATQVPAMADAAMLVGLGETDFEQLLERFSQRPEDSFEELRQLLFDTSQQLLGCADGDAAASVLERAAESDMAALLYHYELPTWVLYARAYGGSTEPAAAVREVDRALRQADDALAWLDSHWLSR